MSDSPPFLQYASTVIFAVAVLHTFSTRRFEQLARASRRHAGLFRLLGEVEVVFGFWAMVLLVFAATAVSPDTALSYLESRNFTEPLFVFVILVMAGTRPVLHFAETLAKSCARVLPLPESLAYYIVTLSLVPLLGSVITEPAAMTLAALMLRDRYYRAGLSPRLKYATLAVLLVNVSIGGVLTSYAAPPVLMVAREWGWDSGFMAMVFGWKAALAAILNAAIAALVFRRELAALAPANREEAARIPTTVTAVHFLFLAGAVAFSHHPAVFLALFLFFLGFTEAYREYQEPLMLREGLLVAFFLAGLVVLGGMQHWWLQPLLSRLNADALYFGATALTAVTDNAALTYLGSQVEGLSDAAKYALVAGAVTGGGLTVIANAPNPAGFAVLADSFDDGTIDAARLLVAALAPTAIAVLCFWVI